MRSLASFHLYRGEFDKSGAVGRELLELAEQLDDAGLQVEGHLVVGSSSAFGGEVAVGLGHLEQAIGLFDPGRHQPGPYRLGPSSGVVSYSMSAFLLWLLGCPDRAAERSASAVELAQELNHPVTLAYILFHVGFLDLSRSDFELAHNRAGAVLKIAEEHDYQIWRAVALVLEGAAMSGLGRAGEGLERIDQGIALYQGMKTPPVFWPLLLSTRTRGFLLAGRPEEGLPLVDEAIDMTGEGNFLYPEFALLEGDLYLALADVDRAELWFRRAFDAGDGRGARMPQLRAATRLIRLQRTAASRTDAIEALRDVYGAFTEGFDTPELVEARAILDGVDAGVT